MHHSITSLPQSDRQALTLSLLTHVTPYLQQSARARKLDFEDLYQDASLKILHILDQYRDQVHHLQAYVMVSIRNLVREKVKSAQRLRTVSLDEPLLSDVSLTLADLLPDPYSVEPVVVVLAQERLEELHSRVAAAKHYKTRRMLGEMHATALAGVSLDDCLQLVQC